MPILENTTDYSAGDQLTAANLNALTESAKFVKSTGAVASTGNTTDETTLDINSSGEIYVPNGGIDTAQLADSAVELAKMAANSVDSDQYVDGSIDNAHLADDAVNSEEIASGAIDYDHLAIDVINGATAHSATNRPDDADALLMLDTAPTPGLVKTTLDVLAKHPAFPQAYGNVTFDTGAPALNGAYKCSLNSDTTTTRVIDLTTAMADENYTVITSYEEDAGVSATTVITINSSSQFTITSSEAAGRVVHFAVFGTLSES